MEEEGDILILYLLYSPLSMSPPMGISKVVTGIIQNYIMLSEYHYL
jgi:hypothetical protein